MESEDEVVISMVKTEKGYELGSCEGLLDSTNPQL